MSIFSKVSQAVYFAKVLMGIYPELMDLIKAVESPGNGQSKLETVLELVVPIFDGLPDEIRAAIGGDKIRALITSAINVIVAFFNATGVFAK